MSFGIVAFLTSRNDVAFSALTAAGDGHDMVHGQFFGWRRAIAVMADTFGTATFPPLRVAEFSGFAPFPVHFFFCQIVGKWFHFLYVFTGWAPPFHSGVYVPGHFNDLAAVAFLPPPRSPAKSMRENAVSPTAKSLK